MKKLSIVLILLVLTLGLCSLAQADYTCGDFVFQFNGSTASITDYAGRGGKVEVPAAIVYQGKEYEVNAIASYAFRGDSGITAIVIPDSITVIGNGAFTGCTGITSVTVPPAVESISAVFPSYQKITTVNLVGSFTSIPDAMFQGCSSLARISLPSGIQSIGRNAFYGCSRLGSISLPSSVQIIGNYAFANCSSLTYVRFPANVYTDGTGLFQNCVSLKSITLPSSVNAIGESMFSGCTALVSVNLNYVDSIGDSAFAGCTSLTEIDLPENVTYVGRGAYSGCSGVKTISLPKTIQTIGSNAFNCVNVSKVLIPAYVSGISSVFPTSRLTTIVLLNDTVSVSSNLLTGCTGLRELTIPASVSSIAYNSVFASSSLTVYTTHGSYAYSYCLENNINVVLTDAHSLVYHEGKAATCTESGYKSYVTCKRDGCQYSTYEEIPALGHQCEHHSAKAATCTEVGWYEYDVCTREGCDYNTYVEIPALGHTTQHYSAKEPTCTECGWYAYEGCTRCSYSTYVEIPALGHNYLHYAGKEPTCTECGWYEYDVCTRCSHSTYQEIHALGHDLLYHESQAPTYVSVGWYAYETCTRCSYSTYEEIPMLKKVTEVNLSDGSGVSTFDETATVQIEAEVLPLDAYNRNLIWSSSDESIATVSSTGFVTFHKLGTVVITAVAEDGWGAYGTIQLTAEDPYVPLTDMSLKADRSIIVYRKSDRTIYCTAANIPANASNPGFTWSSSDTSIAVVSDEGVVTFKKAGVVNITATAMDNTSMSKSIRLRANKTSDVIKSLRLKVDSKKISLKKGKGEVQVTAIIKPDSLSDVRLKWSVDKCYIATVDQNGYVTFKQEGTVTITCRTMDGSDLSDSITLNGVETPTPLTSFKLYFPGTRTAITLADNSIDAKQATWVAIGKSVSFTPGAFKPSNLVESDKKLIWKSLNPGIAKVSNGTITGKARGMATISVTSKTNPCLVYYFKIQVK